MALAKLLDPTNDFIFKTIFGTERHKLLLLHFLNDMLEREGEKKIKEVSFLSPLQAPETKGGKQSVVDLLCKDAEGDQYIVEMQVARVSNFSKRAQYYAAKIYANQIIEGDPYEHLKSVIFLAVTDFALLPGSDYYHSIHEICNSKTKKCDLQELSFSFLELPKFKKKLHELETNLERWAYFFKHASQAEPYEIQELTTQNPIFGIAYQALERSQWTRSELALYDHHLKKRRDEYGEWLAAVEDAEIKGREEGREEGIQEGLEKGLQQGIEEGRNQEKRQIAQQLLKKGLSLEAIEEITGVRLPSTEPSIWS